jgi:fructuronate reductase
MNTSTETEASPAMNAATPLNRSTANTGPAAPVRIVHLGLGAFHRAHQAWYTKRASDGAQWGIAAFTGRRPDAATALSAQDGLYTLIERAGNGDSFELMTSIVEAHDGADVAALSRLVAAPTTAMVTLTLTEAAYNLAADGTLDLAKPAVQDDIDVLRAITGTDGAGSAAAVTAPGRLVQALASRRSAGAGPIAVVSCDNLANNAVAARAAIGGLADVVDPGLGAWIAENVSFVGTSIDRITPRTTEAEIALVAAETGFADSSPVVTEPFSDWVLSGAFPAGRPDWESAGAVFVDEIEHFENRKLWLLNGAHSILAYGGLLRGHATVADAIADGTCRRWVDEWWDQASAHLCQPAPMLADYREQLLRRFANPRIRHLLSQIAMDGSQKLRVRVVPVLRRERAAGRPGGAALRVLACWIAYLRSAPADLYDPPVQRLRVRTRDMLSVLDSELAGESGLVADLDELVAELL